MQDLLQKLLDNTLAMSGGNMLFELIANIKEYVNEKHSRNKQSLATEENLYHKFQKANKDKQKQEEMSKIHQKNLAEEELAKKQDEFKQLK